jgi:transcriptional regulator with XRE-family HTH domain
MNISFVVDELREEYHQRKLRNHNYSMRAFARDVGIAQSSLSKIFNGQIEPSLATLIKMCHAIEIDPGVFVGDPGLLRRVSNQARDSNARGQTEKFTITIQATHLPEVLAALAASAREALRGLSLKAEEPVSDKALVLTVSGHAKESSRE